MTSARSVRTVVVGAAAAVALAGAVLTVTQAGAGSASRTQIADGVVYLTTKVDGSRVHVVRITPGARMRLGVVPAHGRIGGGTETVRSMADRADALVAVNGDFFADGTPQGGVVSRSHLLRSPQCDHRQRRPQLSVRPLWQDGCGFDWTAAFRAGGATLRVDRLNRAPFGKELVVYDANWGRPTPRRHGFEVVLRLAEPRRAGAVDRDIRMTWDHRGRARGGTTAGARELVVSAAGREARTLRRLWNHRRTDPSAVLRLHLSRPTNDNVGCRPRLLTDGHRTPLPDGPFSRGRHARTALAWDRDGRRWIVTVDDGHGSTGWSLRQLTTYLRGLGATDACNLDGGGSSTMVVRGKVVNDPSDGRLRPVVNSVVVTPAPPRKPTPNPNPQPPNAPGGILPTVLPTLPGLPE
jgi:hypothetical protein